MEGLFWEKFFFFSTKIEIYFLQIIPLGKVMIKLADSLPNYVFHRSKSAFESELIDDLESEVGLMPAGQLQFLTVVNNHLMAVNQYEEVVLIPLNTNPYVEFCVELVCGASDRIADIYKKCSEEIK